LTYRGIKEQHLKYTKEITDRLVEQYKTGVQVQKIAQELEVPERSIIAKLSSLGVYQKKSYTNKRGEVPVKKAEHIEKIAQLLKMDPELLESLEKVNKGVLQVIERELSEKNCVKVT
jgi:DNA-directed RNA polymerase specialized sigma subunit